MMDKSRYPKKAKVAKSRQETEQKQRVEENAQKIPTPISESKSVKENESVSKKASEKTTQSENGGFFVSQDAAEKLRLTMLRQSEMMKQIAGMFGGESSDGNELEEVPEVKPKAFSGSKMTPKPETDEESDEESDAEPEYKPKHSIKPKPQVNSPMPDATVEDEEFETESGWKLDRVYELCDSRTGELRYVRNDDFWTAYQFAGENYRRIWVWLHDGRFVREASPSEVNEIYPGLFLSKG